MLLRPSAIFGPVSNLRSEHSRSIPDVASASRSDSLLAGVRVPEIPVNAQFPTGIELQARAQSGKGAGGPDGWTADETKHLPCQTLEVLAQLFEQVATVGDATVQFQ